MPEATTNADILKEIKELKQKLPIPDSLKPHIIPEVSFDPSDIIDKVKDVEHAVERVKNKLESVAETVEGDAEKIGRLATDVPSNWLGTLESDLNQLTKWVGNFAEVPSDWLGTVYKDLNRIIDKVEKTIPDELNEIRNFTDLPVKVINEVKAEIGDASKIAEKVGNTLKQGIGALQGFTEAGVAANAVTHSAKATVTLFEDTFDGGKTAGAEIKAEVKALTSKFAVSGEKVMKAIGVHVPGFVDPTSAERKVFEKLKKGLDSVEAVLNETPNQLLNPLGKLLPADTSDPKAEIKRLGIFSDVATKLEHVADLMNPPAQAGGVTPMVSGFSKKDFQIEMYVLTVLWSALQEFSAWVAQSLPVTLGVGVSVSGGEGAYASIGGSSTLLAFGPLLLGALAAFAAWIIQALTALPIDLIYP